MNFQCSQFGDSIPFTLTYRFDYKDSLRRNIPPPLSGFSQAYNNVLKCLLVLDSEKSITSLVQ